MTIKTLWKTLIALSAVLAFATPPIIHAEDISLLNVSYDPTRELYQEFNAAFAKHWMAKTARPTARRSRFWSAKAIPRASKTGATWSNPESPSLLQTLRPPVSPAGTTWPRGAMP
jgi:hypothetical protein